MKNLNNNSIGYTIKYKINIDEDLNNIINPISYEILMCYLIENIIFTHQYHIVYHIYNLKKDLYISFFHTNEEYLQSVHSKIIKNIIQLTKEISKNIRLKFINNLDLPFGLQIKILNKEYPTLIQTICNKINDKKILKKSKEIVISIINILQINNIEIIEYSSIQLSTYCTIPDPIFYLDSTENIENSITEDNETETETEIKIEKEKEDNKNIEFINKNIKELFWRNPESKSSKMNKNSNKLTHSLIFTFIFALIVYLIPKFMNRLSDINKNNIIIDNILDLATEDLTQTNMNKKTQIIKKLDPIIEQPYEPNEPMEPSEPSDQPDELKIIANNILKKYNESTNQSKNIELKNIKNRLKLILEETSTN